MGHTPTDRPPDTADRSGADSRDRAGIPHGTEGPGLASTSVTSDESLTLRCIVAATDLSERGECALRTGAALARRAGARFEVVSVSEIPSSAESLVLQDRDPTGFLYSVWQSTWQSAKNQAREADAYTNPPHVRIGGPTQLIAEEAHKLKADLLVLGSHPHSRLERILARSTVERITRSAPCPVLVTPRGKHGPFRRILAATDLSIQSDPVLAAAASLALVDGADLRVLHVEDTVADFVLRLTPRDTRRARHRARLQFRQIVEGWGFPLELKVESRVRSGRVGRAILDDASGWDADLVVLGSHRYGLLGRSLLGSVSLNVLRAANRATLIVPRLRG